jgi:hypothetical protein
MPEPSLSSLTDQLWRLSAQGTEPQISAILDAARDERIYPAILNSDNEYICLYRGNQAIDLADVAPYLVKLERGDAFAIYLLSHGWGNSWGIFFSSDAPFNQLRQHFRTFLMVYDDKGKPLYFRYYDPRVLRVYLPTCNADEIEMVFGPVAYYLLEGEDPNTALRFRNRSGVLQQEKLLLTTD